MDRLIPVVNRLQDVFTRCGVAAGPIADLPQVVVVGAQSSGKSSVLEAIIGKDFLPRGSGVVTRRPLLIQLVKMAKTGAQNGEKEKKGGKEKQKEGQGQDVFWVEFLHRPGEKFADVASIRDEIQAETDRSAGTNKKLVPTALIVKVYSSDVVDLTVIDLPGITKVPVGDQPADIERLIRAMINSYIENANSIILAVHPANTDLATSDALQMARAADPHGARTLGVITKLDLMDNGTNALDMLNGRVIPLRRGFIGVVNRSQAALDEGQAIVDARDKERTYFKTNPVYAPYAAAMGSAHLAATLSGMLMEHIRDTLPEIRVKLASHLSHVTEELDSLGAVMDGGGEHEAATLLNLLTRYAGEYSDALDGRSSAATHELAGGARISYIFHSKFGRDLDKMDPFHELTVDDIRTALRNATGHRTPLFIPESAFELLVKRQISRFLAPSLSCVELVYDELTRLAESIESPELTRFTRLRDAVSDTSLRLLKQQKEPTIEMVRNLVTMELSYINTWHPGFVGGKRALTVVSEEHLQQQQAQQNAAQVADVADKLASSQQYNAFGTNRGGAPSLSSGRESHPDAWVEKNLLGQGGGTPPQPSRAALSSSGTAQMGRHYSRVGERAVNGGSMGNGLAAAPAPYLRADSRDNRGGVRDKSDSISSLTVPAHIRVGTTEPMNEAERQELAIMRMLIESYFDIVRKNLQDSIPKAVITFLVNRTKESLQTTLVTKLYKPENVGSLMREGDAAAQRRKDLIAVTQMLKEALDVINEVRDVY